MSPPADTHATSKPAPGVRSRRGVPRGLTAYDNTVLALLAAPALLGVLAFGGVRFFLAGPLVLLACAGWLLFLARAWLYPEVRRVHVPPGTWIWLLFLAYALVRMPFAASPHEARMEVLTTFACLVVYWGAADVGGAGRRWRVVLGLVLLVITFLGWYAIVQHARGSTLVWHWPRPEGYGMRASGTYFCPNHFAGVLAMGLCVGLVLVLTPEVGVPLRLLGGYALLLLPYPLVLTQSRAGMLGALAGMAVAAWLMAWRRSIRLAMVALVVLPLLAAVAGGVVWAASPVMRERMLRVAEGEDVRPELWRNTLALAAERPWLGWGGGSFRWVQGRHQTYSSTHRARFAHNEPLHVAAEHGSVGLALLAAACGAVLLHFARRARRARRARDGHLAACAAGLLAGGIVHGLFDFNFHIFANNQLLVLLLGTLAALGFASGEVPAWFPGRLGARAFRFAGCAAGAAALLAAAATLASMLLVFPAEKAQQRMEDREAERLYRLALRIDPGNWEPPLALGKIRRLQAHWNPEPEQKRRLYDEAVAFYRQALQINPWQAEARYGIALVDQAQGAEEDALAELRAIVERVPRHAFYHTELGRQLRRMGRDEEAMEAFRTAVGLDRRDEVARNHIRSLRRKGVR